MTENTCAACDCELDGNSIKVTVGGREVEVCCDDCARAVGEAQASAASALSAVAAAGRGEA
jgi:ribosome-binding protein aMBF1 (putative translation factor)